MTRRTGPGRLVLVLAVYGDDAQVCLLSNETECGGTADVILEPQETGLPYRLIAETDMTGPVSAAGLERIGAFPVDELWPEAWHPLTPDLSDVPAERLAGLRILSTHDSRWAWKEREMRELYEWILYLADE